MSEITTPKIKAPKPEKYVTVEKFDQLTDILSTLVTTVSELKNKTATPAEVKQTTEVEKAKADQAPMNPAWDEKAREIVGEAVDHCEVFYPRGGGTIFTIVIKPEHSNAPQSYLEYYKMDRRTREIGSEGMAGVEMLARLVKQNLNQHRATK